MILGGEPLKGGKSMIEWLVDNTLESIIYLGHLIWTCSCGYTNEGAKTICPICNRRYLYPLSINKGGTNEKNHHKNS